MTAPIYIHIPFCKQKCSYCDFFSIPIINTHKNDYINPIFIENLKKELYFRFTEYGVTNCNSIYIGGGTPSILDPAYIIDIDDFIFSTLLDKNQKNQEFTIEVNPENITQNLLEEYSKTHINRLSIGIQTFDSSILKTLGRNTDFNINKKALSLINSFWNKAVSIDLMAGLPGQTFEILRKDIETVVSLNPNHISFYSLTIEDGTPLNTAVNNKSIIMPSQTDADAAWILGRNLLEEYGYQQYEISNFCINNAISIHNSVYWDLDSYIGIGPGATGTRVIGSSCIRYTNSTDIHQWLLNPIMSSHTEEILQEDFLKETIMMNLRTLKGIDRNKFYTRFGKDIFDYIPKTIKKWKATKKLYTSQTHVSLTHEGLLFLNHFLIEAFDELSH